MATVKSLGVAGGIALAITVVCVAVLLRPLQISLVQFLEGYWGTQGRRGYVKALAVERHLRNRGRAMARRDAAGRRAATTASLTALAEETRGGRVADRLVERAAVALSRYPIDPAHVMPTSLGNVLRRTETQAGERYGLSTVETYPRVYQQISTRLEAEIGSQVDTLDSTATFVVLFLAQMMLTLPLAVRLDWWSWTPAVFGLLAVTAYVGAVRAAKRYGSLVEVAYDLHRFDLLEALHLPLPTNPRRELAENRKLSTFLAGPAYPEDLHPPMDGRYKHPELRQVDEGHINVAVDAGGSDKPADDAKSGTDQPGEAAAESGSG